MKTINQIKLSLTIGVLVILVPLSGFPYGVKTFILVALGIILVYVKVVALHNEKNKTVKKPTINKRSHSFVENKPYQEVAPTVENAKVE